MSKLESKEERQRIAAEHRASMAIIIAGMLAAPDGRYDEMDGEQMATFANDLVCAICDKTTYLDEMGDEEE